MGPDADGDGGVGNGDGGGDVADDGADGGVRVSFDGAVGEVASETFALDDGRVKAGGPHDGGGGNDAGGGEVGGGGDGNEAGRCVGNDGEESDDLKKVENSVLKPKFDL